MFEIRVLLTIRQYWKQTRSWAGSWRWSRHLPTVGASGPVNPQVSHFGKEKTLSFCSRISCFYRWIKINKKRKTTSGEKAEVPKKQKEASRNAHEEDGIYGSRHCRKRFFNQGNISLVLFKLSRSQRLRWILVVLTRKSDQMKRMASKFRNSSFAMSSKMFISLFTDRPALLPLNSFGACHGKSWLCLVRIVKARQCLSATFSSAIPTRTLSPGLALLLRTCACCHMMCQTTTSTLTNVRRELPTYFTPKKMTGDSLTFYLGKMRPTPRKDTVLRTTLSPSRRKSAPMLRMALPGTARNIQATWDSKTRVQLATWTPYSRPFSSPQNFVPLFTICLQILTNSPFHSPSSASSTRFNLKTNPSAQRNWPNLLAGKAWIHSCNMMYKSFAAFC